jgi:hypothetical protein
MSLEGRSERVLSGKALGAGEEETLAWRLWKQPIRLMRREGRSERISSEIASKRRGEPLLSQTMKRRKEEVLSQTAMRIGPVDLAASDAVMAPKELATGPVIMPKELAMMTLKGLAITLKELVIMPKELVMMTPTGLAKGYHQVF